MGPSRNPTVALIAVRAGFELSIEELPQRALVCGIHPAVDAVSDDVIERRQIEIGRGHEIDGVKANIRDRRLGCEAPRMVDVRRHRVDGVKGAARMGCSKDVGGDPLAAPQVAPGKAGAPGRRLDPGYQCNMIEPGGGQRRFEVAQVWDVGRVAMKIAGHRRFPGWSTLVDKQTRPRWNTARYDCT